MMLIRLALRNLWKYRKRNAVVLFGIVFSVVIMAAVNGMLAGMQEMFFSDILRGSGHIQLHAKGWEDRLDGYSLEYLIDQPQRIARELRGSQRVTVAEPILSIGALAGRQGEFLPLVIHGVSSDTNYYSDVRDGITRGSFVSSDVPGVVLSKANAELLDVAVGESLSLLVQQPDGSLVPHDEQIVGLFDTGISQYDDGSLFLEYGEAGRLAGVGGRSNEIRIMLTDPDQAESFVEANEPLLAEYELVAETWRDIHGSILVFVELSDLMAAVINAFVVIVAASVITNAILMTAFDRLSTFGALRAIGLKKRGLRRMLVTEGTVLGLVGAIVGLAIAVPMNLYFERHGLDIGELGAFFGAGTTYYFSVEVQDVLVTFAFGVAITTLSALYAGIVLARKNLIESIQGA